MFNFFKKRKIDIKSQLKTFKRLGFEINNGVDINEVIKNWGGAEEFEKYPYSFLYMTFGSTIEREPWAPVTNKVWHFDTEA